MYIGDVFSKLSVYKIIIDNYDIQMHNNVKFIYGIL